MKDFQNIINIDEYDYDLPEERIAQYPQTERDGSRLLVYRQGSISEDIFRNITEHLPASSLLVFNNTRVIRARLLFTKQSGSNIEVLLLEPLNPSDYSRNFASEKPVEWKCMIGNLKKWKEGPLSLSFEVNKKQYKLIAIREGPAGEAWRVKFCWEPGEISFAGVINSAGHIPLPPYVNREDEEIDNIRYQTVYGKISGSVASPTAGLHFTEKVLYDILNKGIDTTEITLHVGAGTFQPVRSNNLSDHVMHCEHYAVTRNTIENLLSNQGRIIAVGTTSVRTLESMYWLGRKLILEPDNEEKQLHTGQWEPYQPGRAGETSVRESFESLLRKMDKNGTENIIASTSLMIIPGYDFRIINAMITNFHQPRSTLLLLVSAWTGKNWKKIYDFAMHHNFRFLSYGDSSLLIK